MTPRSKFIISANPIIQNKQTINYQHWFISSLKPSGQLVGTGKWRLLLPTPQIIADESTSLYGTSCVSNSHRTTPNDLKFCIRTFFYRLQIRNAAFVIKRRQLYHAIAKPDATRLTRHNASKNSITFQLSKCWIQITSDVKVFTTKQH